MLMMMEALQRYFDGETAEELSINANAYAEQRDPEEYRQEWDRNQEFERLQAENQTLQDQLINAEVDRLMREGLREIQDTIATIDPLPGAREFLDELRSVAQVIIISDTFTQFAMPLMKKLNYPTLFCNTLEVAADGQITDFKMRIENSKLTTVKALQSMGFDTIAAGDSFNDLAMIKASRAGFLFRSTEQIKKDNPDIPAFEEFDDFLAAIKNALR